MSTSNSKKKSNTTLQQIKCDDFEKNKKEELNEENDEEKTNRKSLRIKNNINKTSVPQTITTTTTTSKRKQINETVNGAQFVSAASVGKIYVNNSNNNLPESNSDSKQVDLVKLTHNVDEMSKILTEHAGLFKKLTNSIDKLSNKLDNTIKSINTTNQQNKKTSLDAVAEQNIKTGYTKLQMRGRLKRRKNQDIDNEEESEEAIEKMNDINYIKKAKSQEQEEKNEILDDEEDTIELINQNKLINEKDKKETNENCYLARDNNIIINRNENGKLIKLKLEDELPPNENQDGNNKNINSYCKETLNAEEYSKKNNNDLDTDIERKQSKRNSSSLNNSSNYITDSSKSEDDDNDDDDDELDDDDENESKKSRSSTNSHKSSNIAILNKTKIDTEFISNLIANKDPNDKRYDPNEINKLRLLSHSYQNFAVKLLVRLFDEEEIIGRNVYGRNYSGDKSVMKQPLDPERINFIKETVLRLTKTNNPELAWSSCVIAMNRKMVDINNKYKKK